MDGKRSNYIPLIELFDGVYFDRDFQRVNNIIRENFLQPKQAKSLKSKLYGEDSLIDYPESERQIVSYLIKAEDISFLDGINLNLERRLINLLQNAIIDVPELLILMHESPEGRLSDKLWDEIDITDALLIELLESNRQMVLPLLTKSQSIVYNSSLGDDLNMSSAKYLLCLTVEI